MDRPWSQDAIKKNHSDLRGKAHAVVQPIREQDWMWFKGDRVELLTVCKYEVEGGKS